MRTIAEPKEQISALWGQQRIKESDVYRLMQYVLRVDYEGKVLLHNVVTGQFVELDQDEAKMLEQLPAVYSPVMEQLVAKHYLVPEGFDEYNSVNQLRKIFRSRSYGDAITHYIILPTTFCNAHCFYCYESDYPHVHMTEETARKVIEYIDEHRKGKGVNISWFGGEPLVGMTRIDQISQGLIDRKIPFESTMISNGYLFDETVIQKCVHLWNLKRIQITLDGTEEVYNRVKAYTNAKENPFQRVLRNIDLLSENNIPVNIRLNVDFYNKDDILTLIEDLGRRYSGKQHVSVYVNMLFNNLGFEPVHHSQEEMIDLIEIVEAYTKRLTELNLCSEGLRIPSLQIRQCMADNPHAVEIQPDGSFCRCEHENVNDSYGSIDDGIIDPEKPRKWLELIQRSDYCPKCCFYPYCYVLKHCMNSETPCVDSVRLKREEAYKEQLRAIYIKKMEDEKK